VNISINDIIDEAMERAGKRLPLEKNAAADIAKETVGIIEKLKNFDKMASSPDDILIIYANLIKEANKKALKKLGLENGLSLR
jgi:hypothetical protein